MEIYNNKLNCVNQEFAKLRKSCENSLSLTDLEARYEYRLKDLSYAIYPISYGKEAIKNKINEKREEIKNKINENEQKVKILINKIANYNEQIEERRRELNATNEGVIREKYSLLHTGIEDFIYPNISIKEMKLNSEQSICDELEVLNSDLKCIKEILVETYNYEECDNLDELLESIENAKVSIALINEIQKNINNINSFHISVEDILLLSETLELINELKYRTFRISFCGFCIIEQDMDYFGSIYDTFSKIFQINIDLNCEDAENPVYKFIEEFVSYKVKDIKTIGDIVYKMRDNATYY